MKVLLTGSAGLVGSHILDALRARDIETTLLLRASSNPRFIEEHLRLVTVCPGQLSDGESLQRALRGVSHIIHCAGRTKALRPTEFYDTNQWGTRRLVLAANEAGVQRFVHISSLAASHPASAACPAREEDPPAPISDYGRSKLAGEMEVVSGFKGEPVILRPPAVYGPRDSEFLKMLKLARWRLLPAFGGGRQPLSLVYAKDLAAAVVLCLNAAGAAGRTYNVASAEVITVRDLGAEMARQLNRRALPLPFPLWMLWAVGWAAEGWAKLRQCPTILDRRKYHEMCAPGWVCDSSRLRNELGFTARTWFREGLSATLTWYRRERWL
jgi:2-alkyl-3-oxoalkanoate reductase